MPELDPAETVKLLSIFESGVMEVLANGKPLVKVDANAHSIDAEVAGIGETGIKMKDVLPKSAEHDVGLLKTLQHTAGALSDQGWSVHIYDKGKKILSIGKDVSKLTGHVSVNLLRIRELREAMKTVR